MSFAWFVYGPLNTSLLGLVTHFKEQMLSSKILSKNCKESLLKKLKKIKYILVIQLKVTGSTMSFFSYYCVIYVDMPTA